MSYFTAKDVSITVDKAAELLLLKMGPHSVTINTGEWSKLIARPIESTHKVIIPLHE